MISEKYHELKLVNEQEFGYQNLTEFTLGYLPGFAPVGLCNYLYTVESFVVFQEICTLNLF